MIRGTTPTHTFELPFDCNVISALRITYAQRNEVRFSKAKDACSMDGCVITCKLRQEETLLLDCGEYAQVQIKVLTTSGDVLVSDIVEVFVDKCLDDEVI